MGEGEYVGSYSAYGQITRRVLGHAGDYAVINKYSYSPYTLPYRVISAKAAGETLEVRRAETPNVGDVVCWTGGTSDITHCGTITAARVPSTYSGLTVDNTFVIRGCARRGDSGGPVFAIRHDSAQNVDYAVAVGIVVAITDTAGCLSTDHVVAQPILPILSDFNLTIP